MLIGRLSQMRPAPLSLWHCDPELCSIEKRFQVNGATLGRSCPPGVQVLPHCVYVLTEPVSLFKCGKFHISTKSTLWAMSLWILVAKVARQWLLGRGQCVLRWFRIGCLLPRVKRAHPHVSMTLLSWDIPLISFNGSLWDVLLRCSKWLLGAWLDSFTMILRCWLVVWVKWARPLVSMTLWSRVMFNWKAVQLKGRPISWAVLHHWKSMGQIFVPSCPPGVQLLPHFEVWSTEPASLFKCGKFHISVKSTLWATRRHIFFAIFFTWGNFGSLLPPRGATFTPFWGMVLQSLPASWNVANFTFLWNPLSELRGVKVFLNVKSMRLILPLFCPWGKHRTPDRL